MKAVVGKKILLNGVVQSGYFIFDNEKITETGETLPKGFSGEIISSEDAIVLPGLVDSHVHINEPGRTEWEGFDTATHAAAAGGITTVVDMPLNCIPVTTSKKALEEKLTSINSKLWVDCGFWGGVTPDSIHDLPELLDSGVLGVKSFLIDSGIDEFQMMEKNHLLEAMPIIAKKNIPYLIHAEICPSNFETNKVTHEYQSFLNSRPRSWENSAIELMIDLSEKFNCSVHIVHLSSSDALSSLKKAKETNIPITVETCPHYLSFFSETIPNGKTLFKCCPPIREKENRESLWNGLISNDIDFIVSDHSPCIPQLKCIESGDLDKAWGGISSLQFGLSIIWSEARERGVPIEKVSEWMSLAPAKFIGLGHKKGSIDVGKDADFIIWDPNQENIISSDQIYYKNKITPYSGINVFGEVKKTYLRGHKVYDSKTRTFSKSALGKPLLKGLL